MIIINDQLARSNFTLRAAAVICRPSPVLLHRALRDDFWSLPGGRCEMREPSASCIERDTQRARRRLPRRAAGLDRGNVLHRRGPLEFDWFDLSELNELTIYPAFLRSGLQHLPGQTRHILDWQLP